jgi:hypothetical protein
VVCGGCSGLYASYNPSADDGIPPLCIILNNLSFNCSVLSVELVVELAV